MEAHSRATERHLPYGITHLLLLLLLSYRRGEYESDVERSTSSLRWKPFHLARPFNYHLPTSTCIPPHQLPRSPHYITVPACHGETPGPAAATQQANADYDVQLHRWQPDLGFPWPGFSAAGELAGPGHCRRGGRDGSGNTGVCKVRESCPGFVHRKFASSRRHSEFAWPWRLW